MQKRFHDDSDIFKNICESVEAVYNRCSGAYSVCGIVAGKGMVVFRDPHGIRPLVCGMRTNEDGTRDYIFASENTMFYSLGFKFQGNVQPGEVVFINMQGEMYSQRLRHETFTPDIFEYIYLARPDSMINNVSVYRSRLRMGQNLAKRWLEKYPDLKPDIVIPVPFSSNTAALSFAHEIGVRYSEGIYKNPFVGRTFMMPGQTQRKKSVLQKLSPQEVEIKDKNVLLLDDSIVRGTTSKEVVKMVREAGAKKVYFVTPCPPVKYPDFYGIDIPTRQELIAYGRSEEEVREYIGADILLYQTIPDLVEAVTRRGEHNIDRPSMPYLDGWYVTGDVDEKHMKKLESLKEHTKRC
jgi:amidophosphoribosyltransferase